MRRRELFIFGLTILPLTLRAKIQAVHIAAPGKGFKVSAGETRTGEHYTMKGVTANTLDLKISSSDTGGALAVFEQIGHTPSGGPPLHIHPNQDEWFHVLEGNYKFQVGNDTHRIGQGDTIFLPRNVQHAFVQLSDIGRMIVSYMPAGRMEAFFKATTEWTAPPSKEEVNKIFAAHDMQVVGPPLGI